MLKTALFDCAINEKNCSVDGGRGICPLFSSPPPGVWQLRSSHPREFAIQGQNNADARGSGEGAGRSWNWLMHNTDSDFLRLFMCTVKTWKRWNISLINRLASMDTSRAVNMKTWTVCTFNIIRRWCHFRLLELSAYNEGSGMNPALLNRHR